MTRAFPFTVFSISVGVIFFQYGYRHLNRFVKNRAVTAVFTSRRFGESNLLIRLTYFYKDLVIIARVIHLKNKSIATVKLSNNCPTVYNNSYSTILRQTFIDLKQKEKNDNLLKALNTSNTR